MATGSSPAGSTESDSPDPQPAISPARLAASNGVQRLTLIRLMAGSSA